MARGRRFRSYGDGKSLRRRVTWSAGPGGVLSPASSTVSLFPTAQQALVADLTLVRTRGELLVLLLSAAAAQQGFQFAVGICNVTENAFNAGVAAVPAPLADVAWDGWLYHTQGTIKSFAAGTFSDIAAAARIVVDSKAMRKTHQTDFIIAVLETVEAGTATAHFELHTRILDKLA